MVNKVILVGRIGKDAVSDNEKHPIKFSVATSENFRDEKEESGWRSETTWHNITLWSKDQAKQHMLSKLVKGAVVYLEGKIKTSEWQNSEGETRKSNDITAAFVKVMPKATGEANPSGSYQKQENSAPESKPAPKSNDTPADDYIDLPF